MKIADFGLSQRIGEVRNLGGTLNYLAPEMFDGKVSDKVDVYAFGKITTAHSLTLSFSQFHIFSVLFLSLSLSYSLLVNDHNRLFII